jgi:hemolysin III
MHMTQTFWQKQHSYLSDKFRDPFSALSHLGAAGLGVIGTLWMMMLAWGDSAKVTALVVYGLSLVMMFSASGIYHSSKASPETVRRLRKMDHSAIFLLIAGTYTPICLYFFSGFFQWGLPLIVWSFALVGVSVKIFVLKAPRWITAGIYLVMGWLCVMAFGQLLVMPAGALFWLILGGLFYSGGALVYITKKPDWWPGVFGFHELWHIFVILGAFSHFVLIAAFIAAV